MFNETTPNLALPFIMPAQAQKHVTHNEAIEILDGLVQLSVKGRSLSEPPQTAQGGDRYIVGDGANGAWAGWESSVAFFSGGGWMRLEPQAGWRAWVEEEEILTVFNGSAWIGISASTQKELSVLGLGTTTDASTPFAAKLNSALWTAREGAEDGTGDLRVAFNKETVSNFVSLLLQSGYSARAELGLMQTDDVTLKVSADGEIWKTALVVDRETGHLKLIGIAEAEEVSAGTLRGVSCVAGHLTVEAPADATAPGVTLQGSGSIAAEKALRLIAGGDGDGYIKILRQDGTGDEEPVTLARFDEGVPNAASVVTRDAGDARFAARGIKAVGCISLLRQTSGGEYFPGDVRDGSGLRYASMRQDSSVADHGTPPGRWTSLSGSGADQVGLWERVS